MPYHSAQSRLIRSMDEAWQPYGASGKRFVESAKLLNNQYRTYWAPDINYDAAPEYNSMKEWKTMGENDYCAENTFDVAHMADENSTSVLIALRLNGGEPFYTTSVTGSDVIYQMPANDVSEEGPSASESFVRKRSSYISAERCASSARCASASARAFSFFTSAISRLISAADFPSRSCS